jgi:hypothetical protein
MVHRKRGLGKPLAVPAASRRAPPMLCISSTPFRIVRAPREPYDLAKSTHSVAVQEAPRRDAHTQPA